MPGKVLSSSNQRVLIKAAKALLVGVGQLPSAVEQHPYAVHYRRGIKDVEYATITPPWCAIPAVHEAGHGIVLETNT